MNTARSTVIKCLATLCLTVAAVPAMSLAQQGGGAGAGAAGQMPQMLTQVLEKLDLNADQKSKVGDVIKQAQQDMRDARQALMDATPEERMQKMQDMQKSMTDARTKVEAELTPEQKTKYFPLLASAGLKYSNDLLAAMKTSAGKMTISDDQKKQVNDVFEETGKSLDGMKDDAGAVKDDDTLNALQQKLTKTQMDTRKQLLDILGQDDGRKLLQSAQQSMRGTMGRTGAPAKPMANPATQPAAK